MKQLSGQAIRTVFTDFFVKQCGHQLKPSASLIPVNPTVLLTPAGMLPFANIFMGLEPPPTPPRAVSIQKCARISGKASDLAFVGRTLRHHTFFEMLGNFSFGDYFKKEASAWAWQFFTQILEMDPNRLWVTVYEDDQNARAIWVDEVGVPNERILNMGAKDNFWGPPGPTGPCGPCSEILFDRGLSFGGDKDSTPLTLDGERFIELWNLVFMELFQDDQGHRAPLEAKNIDTGMGLERLAMVLQGVNNTFETDLLFPLVEQTGRLTGHRYKDHPDTDIYMKIVADHIRCVTFALTDGVVPSNEGRGYIIRMVLRRAVRFAKQLGLQKPGLYQLVTAVRDSYQAQYPELASQYDMVIDTVQTEEAKFLETLERGSKLFEEALEDVQRSGAKVFSGAVAFKLYDTYGFPLELTQDLADEAGLTVDQDAFDAAMNQQREQARSAQGKKSLVGNQVYADILKAHGATTFIGYDALEGDGQILALIQDGQQVQTVGGTNEPFELVLDQTPFYAESGGQVGDHGILYVPEGHHGQTIVVKDTKKIGDLVVHACLFDQGGAVSVGTTVKAEVNGDTRQRTAHNHTATHLLNAALRKLLGDRVTQAGSYVGPDGARFDFTFSRGLSSEELRQLELMVNQWVFENTPREVAVLPIEEAKATGAVAAFDEKYGDSVRVVTFGSHSKEFCGGTHVDRSGDIGLFKIVSEGSIASGVRRIEFITGQRALQEWIHSESLLQTMAAQLKVPLAEVPERAQRLMDEKKALEKTLNQWQEQAALKQVHALVAQLRQDASGVPWVVAQLEVADAKVLKSMMDTLVQQCAQHVVVVGAAIEGRAQFMVAVPAGYVEQGVDAGKLVKLAAEHCQGGGGGKPQFAQAGGKDGSAVAAALALVENELKKTLSSHSSV